MSGTCGRKTKEHDNGEGWEKSKKSGKHWRKEKPKERDNWGGKEKSQRNELKESLKKRSWVGYISWGGGETKEHDNGEEWEKRNKSKKWEILKEGETKKAW